MCCLYFTKKAGSLESGCGEVYVASADDSGVLNSFRAGISASLPSLTPSCRMELFSWEEL